MLECPLVRRRSLLGTLRLIMIMLVRLRSLVASVGVLTLTLCLRPVFLSVLTLTLCLRLVLLSSSSSQVPHAGRDGL
jgi:hypothetical protein